MANAFTGGNLTITNSAGSNITMTTNSTTAILGPKLTDAEKKKLENLREDRRRWVKDEKLRKFQKLPAHLRQEIVDEAHIKDCIDEMENVSEDQFGDNREIAKLEAKEQAANGNNIIFTHGNGTNWAQTVSIDGMSYTTVGNQFKYTHIINEFTKEELADAHSAATIEEAL